MRLHMQRGPTVNKYTQLSTVSITVGAILFIQLLLGMHRIFINENSIQNELCQASCSAMYGRRHSGIRCPRRVIKRKL